MKDENEKKIFRNLTYQLNQHNEYNKYPDHAVRGWHPAAEKKLIMRNFDNLSINYFFAHACTQYFPCLITTENNKEITKQQKQANL